MSGVLARRGPHPLLVVLALVGCLHAFFLLGVELDRTLIHNREIVRLSADVAALEREVSEMRQVAAHASDPVYRETLARALGYVYPHEKLIVTDRR
ncbi:MAG: hypothetical protein KF813_12055 [Trueperaceae bacterium]|nr:hypothetical protein [Trueperaceae bacterium]